MPEIAKEFEIPIREVADLLRDGEIISLATDTTYAIVAALSSKKGVEKLRRVRNVSASKNLSLLLKDLSSISQYAFLDNTGYRLIKRLTPGHYTFILRATKKVPRLTLTNQRTVGIRICGKDFINALCDALDEPLISGSAIISPDRYCETAEEVELNYPDVSYIFDAGLMPAERSTVIDLTGALPNILREGLGKTDQVFV